MHRRMVVVGAVGGVLLLAAAASATVGNAASVVGSWQFLITETSADGSSAANPSLVTFFGDGNVIVHDLPARAAPAGMDARAIVRGGGHGVWADTGDGQVALTFMAYATTDTGTVLGIGTVSGLGALDDAGATFGGPYRVSAVAPDGSSLGSSTGTFSGTRIELVPLD